MAPPRGILLTNDDGVPSPDHSPFIEPFVRTLYRVLGLRLPKSVPGEKTTRGPWSETSLSVVIPSSQRSWIGKSYLINEECEVSYYEHWFPDPRSASASDGEHMVKEQWTLIDGTPSSCVNIGLHNLNDPSAIDLVLAGPNYGRNVSNLTFGSGTIGGTLDGVLCGKKAIAISFAFYKGVRYTDEEVVRACEVAIDVVVKLWNSWPAGVDLFNVNVPIVHVTNPRTDPEVCLTRVHRIMHGGFYVPVRAFTAFESVDGPESPVTSFRFAPAFPFGDRLEPEEGTDAWAIEARKVSVTPINATWNVVDIQRVKEDLKAKSDVFAEWRSTYSK
ncbi:survival protein sure-like phosphatase/nucleotidase [Hyaloraphidium curvatum]|nr:survival protein sure-like phosphatase/nucleotidase [Hyaloraphidium curvatum]